MKLLSSQMHGIIPDLCYRPLSRDLRYQEKFWLLWSHLAEPLHVSPSFPVVLTLSSLFSYMYSGTTKKILEAFYLSFLIFVNVKIRKEQTTAYLQLIENFPVTQRCCFSCGTVYAFHYEAILYIIIKCR